jgi:hypothetical protein
MRAAAAPRRELRLVSYGEADQLLAEGWVLAPEEDANRAIGWVYLERGARWSRTSGWGCAALVSAAVWLVVAGLAWWVCYG